MVSSSQINEQLARLLNNQINLDAFEDWFVRNTWNVHLSGSIAAEDLTFAIEESLSEYSSKHIGEQELLKELGELIHRDIKVLEFRDVPAAKILWNFTSLPALVVSARL